MSDLFQRAAEERWERAMRAYEIAEHGYRQMRLKALQRAANEALREEVRG